MTVKTNEPWAVFLDIDRTLTVEGHKVPKMNVDAIRAAREAGHKVFINTGRSWGNIPDVIFEQLEVDGVVAGNGVRVEVGGEAILKHGFDSALARRVCRFCMDNGIWCIFECDKTVFYLPNEQRPPISEDGVVHTLEDFDRFIEGNRVEVFAAGKIIPQSFIDEFKAEIRVVQFETYADCCAQGFSKATGIELVLEKTGIPRECTVAIGDSGNDLEMLNFCKVGVAVANAEKKVLDCADFVTLSHAESGVAHALKYILKI